MTQPEDTEFVAKAQELLRESETQVSAEQQAQLAAARQAAVATANAPGSPLADERKGGWLVSPWLWAPTGAMAATVLTIALLLGSEVEPLPILEPAELTAAQELELLEDLEFVAWMLEQDEVGAG